MEVEIWKAIPGYEGRYEVSSLGRIKSLARESKSRWGSPKKVPERMLRLSIWGEYFGVTLFAEGKRHRVTVQSCVLAAFVGPKPAEMEICHNDGSRTNNALSNLRYDTRSGNFADKKLHGTHNMGSRNFWAKLNEDLVREIRSASGASQQVIADRFGVNQTTVSAIRGGRSWKHV